MTFQQAIATGLPMRRPCWAEIEGSDPVNQALARASANSLWIYPRFFVEPENEGESAWIWLSNGKPHTLRQLDYLADDWEVMTSLNLRCATCAGALGGVENFGALGAVPLDEPADLAAAWEAICTAAEETN